MRRGAEFQINVGNLLTGRVQAGTRRLITGAEERAASEVTSTKGHIQSMPLSTSRLTPLIHSSDFINQKKGEERGREDIPRS